MRLRSIPLVTCLTLARERRLVSVARDWNKRSIEPKNDVGNIPSGKRGRMRPQVSRKPFEYKLAKLEEELNELAQWAGEGFDVSKIKNEIEKQMERLLDLLEGKNE